MTDNDNNLLKSEILYRSIHRGCKETDHLIGKFATVKIDELQKDQLLIFKDLIVEDDMEIYDWILNKEKAPEKYCDLINAMREFHGL